MKKIYLLSVFISLMIASFFTSCSLDEMPYNITSGELSKSDEGIEQLVTGVYGTFWDNWMMQQTYMSWIDQDNDHCGAPGWVVSGVGNGDNTTHYAYNTMNDLWNVFYRMINRANQAKESIETSGMLNDSKAVRQLYGEVLFLRAYAYFHLVRMYGPVPLRLTFECENDCARSSVKDVYSSITKDLESSLTYLTYKSDGIVGGWGHADKTAAELLLSRVYCTMGSTALACNGKTEMSVDVKGTVHKYVCSAVDGSEEIDAQACYKRVKELCDQIISRKGVDFDLMPNYKSIWGAPNRRNSEFVWGVAGGKDVAYETAGLHYYFSPPPFGGGGVWMFMAPNLYSQYDESDDRIVDGIFHYYLPSYSSTAWVSYPKDAKKYNLANMPDTYKAFINKFNTYYTTAVPCMNKWYRGDITKPTFLKSKEVSQQEQDIPLLRFAEAYLLRAEAEVELDDIGAAMSDVDIIRKRASATTFYFGKVTDKVEARSMVLKERSLEFAEEFNRKFDLLRWGIYLDVMNDTQTIYCGSSSRSTVRSKKSLLFAVPTTEITTNKLFGNNNFGY
jgi:hypothetical protein